MTAADIISGEGGHFDPKVSPEGDGGGTGRRQKLSAVVISYNRADLIGTCLRALSFVDELVVVDKSSTDGTAQIAASFADRVVSIPWSPTVEESRTLAVETCAHEWVLCLDDDECLSVGAARFIEEELRAPRADIYEVPQRHYILGRHSEEAYYWPEHQPRLFRRSAVELRPTVHGGMAPAPGARTFQVPPEGGVCIHHLSHKDVAQWIEKANRYTSQPDRLRADDGGRDLVAFAHARIDAFIAQTKSDDRGGYPAAVAVQRAVYDIIDRLKTWEREEGLDGNAAFEAICRQLQSEYARALPAREGAGLEQVVSSHGWEDGARRGAEAGRDAATLERTIEYLRNSLQHVRAVSELAQRRADETIERQRQTSDEQRRAFEQERTRVAEQHRLALEETSARLTAAADELVKAAHVTVARAREATLSVLQRHRRLRADLTAEIEALTRRAEAAEARAQQEAAAARNAEEQLERLQASEFWAVTAPLRSGTEFVRRAARLQTERARLLARAALPQHQQARGVLAASLRRRLGRSDALPAFSPAKETEAAPKGGGIVLDPHQAAVASYAEWLRRFDTPSALDLERMQATADERPWIAVVARFSPASAHLAERTAGALERCVGVRWGAMFAFDPGCDPDAVASYELRTREDVRFHPESGGFPDGALVVLLEGGAIPREHGLRVLIDALVHAPASVLAYADEDRLSPFGPPFEPWFKPEFSPLLAEQGVLLGRMLAIRPEGGDAARLVRALADPWAMADAVARGIALSGGTGRAVHVPHVLFHDAIPPPVPAPLPLPPLPGRLPLVSILIPTRDGWHLLGPCLDSLKRTDWPADRLEIIVADNGSTDGGTLEGIEAAERTGFIRILRDPRPFNYAQLNNTAARASRGDLLVFLNNDTEVLDPAWLRKLAAFAMQPGAGAIGPKLLYPDGTVQHGGVILGIQGVAAHAHLFLGATDGGYHGLANLTHEVAAVTGACLAVSRAAFEEVGGFDETFRVAFNDIVLCLGLNARGRRNVYVAEPLFTHSESKTRGLDNTPEKIGVLRREMQLAWKRHARLLRDDPFYSPNLSLETQYQLAAAPRRRPAWRTRASRKLRVMMLSATHARGDSVAVVIELQVRALLARGHEVVVAGHGSGQDLAYGGHTVIDIRDPRSAATLATELDIDLIVAHTPPFFGVARWTGAHMPVLACDHGEAPPSLFSDAAARREALEEKDLELSMCTRVLAISETVAAASRVRPDGVLPLGNGHLGRWSPAMVDRRGRARRERGWEALHVVLNVCRFHAGECACKGVDQYAELREMLEIIDPAMASRTAFVLCGEGDSHDVEAMRSCGLHVVANATDSEIMDLYAAADLYANFSRWENYNLGIAQALAMGLPVIASDIPAHRAIDVTLTNEPAEAALLLAEWAGRPTRREPRIWESDSPLEAFATEIEALCSEGPGLSSGASSDVKDAAPPR